MNHTELFVVDVCAVGAAVMEPRHGTLAVLREHAVFPGGSAEAGRMQPSRLEELAGRRAPAGARPRGVYATGDGPERCAGRDPHAPWCRSISRKRTMSRNLCSTTFRPWLAAAVAALLMGGCDEPAAPRPPASLEAVQPAQFTAYAAASTNVFVRVLDRDGAPVRGAVVHWRVLEGGGSVAADSSASDELGVAGTAWTVGTAVGATQRLEASVPGLDPVVFTATPALPPTALITTQGTGQAAPALTPLTDPLMVRVTLPDGRPLEGVPVRWLGPTVPNGVTAPAPVAQQPATSAQGEARATYTVPSRAGTYEVVALVGTDPQAVAVRFVVTAVSGPVAHVSPLTSNTGVCPQAGGVASPPWGVILFDRFYNPVPGVRVEFDVPSDGFPTPESVLTDALGGATTRWTLRTRVGLDSLYVRVPSIGYVTTLTTQVCAAAPVRVALRLNGVEVDTLRLAVGEQQTLRMARYDRYGNPVPFQSWETFSWASLDPAVARVFSPNSDVATVEGVSPGTTRVWGRSWDLADTVVVIVGGAAPFRGAAVANRPAAVTFRARLARAYGRPYGDEFPRRARVTGDAVAGSER